MCNAHNMSVYTIQLKIQHLKVTGLCKTKTDIVVEQIKPLLSASSLQDVSYISTYKYV